MVFKTHKTILQRKQLADVNCGDLLISLGAKRFMLQMLLPFASIPNSF